MDLEVDLPVALPEPDVNLAVTVRGVGRIENQVQHDTPQGERGESATSRVIQGKR